MPEDPHQQTLFHLIPNNDLANIAVQDRVNGRFLTRSRLGPHGLEVGYHVSSIPGGQVIARLGRGGDLRLPDDPSVSKVHVTFEVNPATELIILSVRSKLISTVKFAPYNPDKDKDKKMQDALGRNVLHMKLIMKLIMTLRKKLPGTALFSTGRIIPSPLQHTNFI